MPVTFFESYKTSEAGLNAHKSSALTQIVSSLASNTSRNKFNPTLQIPQKLVQAIIEFSTLFRSDVETIEKVQNGLLALLATAQLGLATTLFFQNQTCEDNSEPICQSTFLLEIFYTSLLSLGWGVSEIAAAMQQANLRLPTTPGLGAKKVAAFTQIIGNFIANLSDNITPIVQIPQKIIQTITGFYAAFRSDIETKERLQNGALGLLAAAQLVLAIIIFTQDKNCEENNVDSLCRASFLLEAFYAGVLSLGWSEGEIKAQIQRAQQALAAPANNIQQPQVVIPVAAQPPQQQPQQTRSSSCSII
ncbi:hypothetical protein ACQUW5_11520 [Legionella sp. CNM-1927-20]|uniref:hypothetical protein n=1 Tax=Legionella sp. CNM-1927-20 TaxID=3422221 RepID=UPI00403ACA17